MNKSIKKITSITLAILIAIVVNVQMISAAGFSISVSNGGNGTCIVTILDLNVAGRFIVSANGQSEAIWKEEDKTGSVTLATGAGSFTVTVYAESATSRPSYDDLSGQSVSQSVTVTVPSSGGTSSGGTSSGGTSGGTSSGGSSSSGSSSNSGSTNTTTPVVDTRSTNNDLASLTVNTGELSPAFSADVTEYTVNLEATATSIGFNGSAADGAATVSGLGEQGLSVGANRFAVTVTAENGVAKNYYINVNVDESPLVFVDYNGQKLGFVRTFAEDSLPLETFEEITVLVEGQEQKAWRSEVLNATIVFLVNEAGEKNYYLYNAEEGVKSKFVPTSILGYNMYIVDIDEEFQKQFGLVYGDVEIEGVVYKGWKFEDESFANYCLIYVMMPNGEYAFYQYESTQRSIQLYSGALTITKEAYEEYVGKLTSTNETKNKVIYSLAGVSVVSLSAAAFVGNKFRKIKKTSDTSL